MTWRLTPNLKPSFSPRRKWGIGLDVFMRTVVVLAVVVMVNYLGSRHFQRLYLSSQTRIQLSSHTVEVLHTLTNQVKVTLYYDKEDSLFSTVSALLAEYRNVNPRVSVAAVDYNRDPGAAQKIKDAYKLGSATDKNLVIFDCGGKFMVVPGTALAEYTVEQVPNEKEREYRRKPVAFKGEMMFTAMLLAVTNPKPLKACFLQGHGEHRIDSGNDLEGYMKFVSVLQQNYIQVEPISLLGTNELPADCNLLVVAGPTTIIPPVELEKIEQYLDQGGRLLALFNASSKNRETGLEKILAAWGIGIGDDPVRDPDNSVRDYDVVVRAFSQHPLVNPLIGSGLYMIQPRPVGRLNLANRSADAPKIDVVAFTGERALPAGKTPGNPRQFPLIVAVEKGAVKGVITERGATRMVVAGDSLFFANGPIDSLANRDFAGYVANWLLDRMQLVRGLGPRPIKEFHLTMTKAELEAVNWILLAALPGAVLLFGGLVWLRRRK